MTDEKTSIRRRRVKRIWRVILVVFCALLGTAAMSNLFFPARSGVVDRLTVLDKARVTEFFHLRSEFGDSLWPGWSAATIPVVIYNEEYAFLTGTRSPDPGWRTVPQDIRRGGAWELVPGDSIDGKEYYRQRLADGGPSPQAFTVRIGEQWAASMTTKEWTAIKMGNEIRDGLPPVIRHFVPYRFIARTFLALALNTDAYICALGHESFHAFQGIVAAQRLASAENVLGRSGGSYPWHDPSFNNAWKAELNMLGDALSAKEEKRTVELVHEFISLRQARRDSFRLDPALVGLERLREWEEGLGKYTELALWERAAADSSHTPVSELRTDSGFDGYKDFSQHWAQELSTLRLQSTGEDIRFYYAGMAQGFLLDRLLRGWRTRILRDNVFLEDLLVEAIAPRSA